MRAGQKHWTDHEVNTLVTMRRRGMSIGECAAALERSSDAIAAKASNLRSRINPKVEVSAPVVVRAFASRAEMVTATLCGDPPAGRSALDQRPA